MTRTVTRRTALRTIGLAVGGVATTVGATATGGAAAIDGRPETVVEFDPGAGELPENVAIDRQGFKYVSMPPRGEVRLLSPDNHIQSTFASFDVGEGLGVLGLEVDPSGTLYACLVTYNTADSDIHGVWRVDPDGEASLFAALPVSPAGTAEMSFPNDILLHGHDLLVTDSRLGAIWRVGEGEATEWVADPLLTGTGAAGFGFPIGANGIAAAADGTVFVANTERGHLVEIPVGSDGSAGTPELFVEDPALVGADGIATDVRDNIYVAVLAGDRVVRVSPDGELETLATAGDGLDDPSDVTFGTARGEQTELFVTNFALTSLANPGLLTLDVGIPGRPIHR